MSKNIKNISLLVLKLTYVIENFAHMSDIWKDFYFLGEIHWIIFTVMADKDQGSRECRSQFMTWNFEIQLFL
jgi:hypothetical protein